MKSTFKTLFYLKKNEPKKNGHVVIMVRITVDGDQVQFSSKLDIHPDNWDTKTGRAVINKQSADKKENLRVSSLNKTLDEIRSAITMHYTRMMNVDGYAAGKNQKRIPGIGGKGENTHQLLHPAQ